ncbi:MAG TPA: hypothetical protein VF778_13510 [Xanthobacteraceae bacterium]
MRTFKIMVERAVIEATTLLVEADHPAEAREIALYETSEHHGGNALGWEYVGVVSREIVKLEEYGGPQP